MKKEAKEKKYEKRWRFVLKIHAIIKLVTFYKREKVRGELYGEV